MAELPRPILLYDGVCGLCHRLVQFIIHRDRRAIFRFASLQSPYRFHSERAAQVRAARGIQPAGPHSEPSLSTSSFIKESIDSPDKFWSNVASELHWFKKWDKVLEWNCPWAKWFVGGQINLSYNCLDRHVKPGARIKPRIIWESEPGEVRTSPISNCIAKCRNSPMF
jgi:hypothetical protein